MRELCVAISFFLCSCPAFGAGGSIYSGEDMHRWIEAEKRIEELHPQQRDAIDLGKFHGYVAGVSDAWTRDNLLCLPPGVKLAQLTAMVAKYIESHPEGWHYTAQSLVWSALAPTFGCKDN